MTEGITEGLDVPIALYDQVAKGIRDDFEGVLTGDHRKMAGYCCRVLAEIVMAHDHEDGLCDVQRKSLVNFIGGLAVLYDN